MHIRVPATSPFTTRDAEAAGVGRNALARLCRAGAVVKHRADLYWNAAEFRAAPAAERHARASTRVAAELASDVVLARTSAACVLGVPTPTPMHDGLEEMHFYTRNTQSARTGTGLHIYTTPLSQAEIVEVQGAAVTSPARTIVDLARRQPLPKALIVVDAGLRRGLTLEQLEQQCALQAGWVGVRSVVAALQFASAASESPLESESRGRFIIAGVPAPRQQVELTGVSGRRYRVDFYWEEFALIGEADGWAKFGASTEEQQANFRREKMREDDLRNAGYRVLRWTYQTIDSAAQQIKRIAAKAS